MDATAIDAYVRGRLAGANYFYAQLRDERGARPNNPYVGPSLAAVEWDRGFDDGYEQGRRGPQLRTADRSGCKAA
jgi:hypothetical protein